MSSITSSHHQQICEPGVHSIVRQQAELPTCASPFIFLGSRYAWPEQGVPGIWGQLLPILLRLPHLCAHIKVQRQPPQLRSLHAVSMTHRLDSSAVA